MIYYTPEMFTVEALRNILEPLFYEKETLEFQIDVFQKKFDILQKLNYKELMLYEKKKVLNPTLLPSLEVLSQIKIISKDESVKEFRKILFNLNKELSNVTNTISNEENKINKMFSFTDVNLKKYLNNLSLYFSGILSFEYVMRDIFNNEFLNANIYSDVATARNYEIILMIIKKIPVDWKDIARIIFEEAKYVYTVEDLSTEEVNIYIKNEEQNRSKRYNVVLNKIQDIASIKSNTKKERSALDASLFNRSSEIASYFVRSRETKHKTILSNIQNAAIARGDMVTKVGMYIQDSTNKM